MNSFRELFLKGAARGWVELGVTRALHPQAGRRRRRRLGSRFQAPMWRCRRAHRSPPKFRSGPGQPALLLARSGWGPGSGGGRRVRGGRQTPDLERGTEWFCCVTLRKSLPLSGLRIPAQLVGIQRGGEGNLIVFSFRKGYLD